MKMTKCKRLRRGRWRRCRTRSVFDSLPEVSTAELELHLSLANITSAAIQVDAYQVPRFTVRGCIYMMSKEGAVELLARSQRTEEARRDALCGKAYLKGTGE